MGRRLKKFAQAARRYQKFTTGNNKRLAKAIETARPITAAVAAATGNPLLVHGTEAVRVIAQNSPI